MVINRIKEFFKDKENGLKVIIIVLMLFSILRDLEWRSNIEGYCNAKCTNMIYGTMFKRTYTNTGIALPITYNYTTDEVLNFNIERDLNISGLCD